MTNVVQLHADTELQLIRESPRHDGLGPYTRQGRTEQLAKRGVIPGKYQFWCIDAAHDYSPALHETVLRRDANGIRNVDPRLLEAQRFTIAVTKTVELALIESTHALQTSAASLLASSDAMISAVAGQANIVGGCWCSLRHPPAAVYCFLAGRAPWRKHFRIVDQGHLLHHGGAVSYLADELAKDGAVPAFLIPYL